MTLGKFRSEYEGEFIILETKIVDGIKQQQREWIANPIENQHISGRATVIGSDVDIDRFDYTRLQRHKGGLRGKKRLQTYGTNGVWKKIKLDFYITTEQGTAEELHIHDYCSGSTVYSTVRNCLTHPGEFFPIPYSPVQCDLAQAVYLAAFDGHTEVFLNGYNNETPVTSSIWIDEVNRVFESYPTVQFILVGTESNMPSAWRRNRNVKCMDHRTFVSYCDV